MEPTESSFTSTEVTRLITVWKEARAAGTAISLEQLCHDHPQLLDEVKSKLISQGIELQSEVTLPFETSPPNNESKPTSDSFPLVPNYQIAGVLGRGGMGVVYRARQLSLNREVALKMVSAGNYDKESVKERFRVEAEAVAALDHSNIIPIYEVGEFEGYPYYSMKLAGEGNLADLMKVHQPSQGVRALVSLLEKVCRAVQHAHERGVIHRDIKTSNILLEKHDQPMLADFGLAKLSGHDATLTGHIIGTPRYMAPEQASGQAKSATTRSDVYSLGVILFEIMTGRAPYVGDDPLMVMMKVVEAKLELPSQLVPGTDRGLEAICTKCLAKEPSERYTSARALADDLAHWLTGEPLSVRPPGTSQVVIDWLRNHSNGAIRLIVIGILSGLVTSLAAMLIILPQVMTSSQISLDKLPSVPRPWLLTFDWELINSIPTYVRFIVFLAAPIAWIMQGPLVLLLMRPRDYKSALAFGLGSGLISSITAFLCGVAQCFLLATVVVPQIVDIRLVSIAATADAAEREKTTKELLEKYVDLQHIPMEDRGGTLLGYLISMQVVGVFEGIIYATIAVIVLGLTTVTAQTLIGYYLERREEGWNRSMLYYVEFTLGILLFIYYSITTLAGEYSRDPWSCILFAGGCAILGALTRWNLARRISVYAVCILVALLVSVNYETEKVLSLVVYVFWIGLFVILMLRRWYVRVHQRNLALLTRSPLGTGSEATTSLKT